MPRPPQGQRRASTAGTREALQEAALVPVGASTALTETVREMEPQFAMALAGSGMDEKRFMRVCLTQFRKTPKLYQCNRPTILGALLTAAQLALDFTLEHAYLIPRDTSRTETTNCQLMIGYKGYIDLARRSGQIKDIDAQEVYEGDEFRYWKDENGPHLFHKEWAAIPPRERAGIPRGEIWTYYGHVIYTNGGVHINVMDIDDIEERRRRSAAEGAGRFSPWRSDYKAMCRKTVIRAMKPFLPLTASVQAPLDRDEGIISYTGSGQDVTTTFLEPPAAPDELDQVTGAPLVTQPSGPPAGVEGREHIDVQSTVSEPSETTTGPPRDPSEPPPNDPRGQAPEQHTTPDIVTHTQATVEGWSDEQVRTFLLQFQLSATGTATQQRKRLLAFCILERHKTNRAVEDLF